MFITLLAATLAIATLTSVLVARFFSKPIASILSRIVAPELAGAWTQFLRFAIYVVGISGGVEIVGEQLAPHERRVGDALRVRVCVAVCVGVAVRVAVGVRVGDIRCARIGRLSVSRAREQEHQRRDEELSSDHVRTHLDLQGVPLEIGLSPVSGRVRASGRSDRSSGPHDLERSPSATNSSSPSQTSPNAAARSTPNGSP